MKKLLKLSLLFLLLVVLKPALAIEHVIITEVLYNPLTTETGTEAVQIYNPTNNSVDISNWVVRTESSQADATIPTNIILQPGQYYLIADANWSQNKAEGWPLADHEESMILANTDAGVAIVNNNTIVDAVGWGNSTNIDAALYEGIPANDSGDGKSLQRKKENGDYIDTNNNYNDFFASTPSFKFTPKDNEILIIAIVSGSAPVVEEIIIPDDDALTAGTQLLPIPEKSRVVTVTTKVSDKNGINDISNVSMEFNNNYYQLQKIVELNATTAQFQVNLSLAFFLLPGNYTIRITAMDTANFNATRTTSFDYQSLLAMQLDTNTVIFNAMPGATSEIVGDKNMNTSNATIRNIGNTALNFKLSGTNLLAGQNIISVEKVQYSIGENSYKPLSISQQTELTNLQPGQNALEKLSLKLAVPTATTPGNYTGKISIVAVT